MKISIKELKTIISEELEDKPVTLGPAGPRMGSTLMTLKSGIGPVMFKVVSINSDEGSVTVESDEFGHETLGLPFKDWKQFTTSNGKTVYFNEKSTCWH